MTEHATSTEPAPSVFRINVEVTGLDDAEAFYSALLGVPGRRQAGSRCYFGCGPVTLQVLDVAGHGPVHPLPKSLYLAVADLTAAHRRAHALGCLATEQVHGDAGGEIAVRPWGERSFYVTDPWGNSLCFVEAGTAYLG